MTPTESVTLARYIGAHFPQQPQDEFTADALGELLEPYPFADARAAVLAIADRGEKWCSPSDVRAEVRRIRGRRIAQGEALLFPPAELADDEAAQRAWLAQAKHRLGDGEPVEAINPNELTGPRDVRELLAGTTDAEEATA